MVTDHSCSTLMSAILKPPEVQLEPMQLAQLPMVLAIEQRAYAHPWSLANFRDSLNAGYEARLHADRVFPGDEGC